MRSTGQSPDGSVMRELGRVDVMAADKLVSITTSAFPPCQFPYHRDGRRVRTCYPA
jgi:hypothetical protein